MKCNGTNFREENLSRGIEFRELFCKKTNLAMIYFRGFADLKNFARINVCELLYLSFSSVYFLLLVGEGSAQILYYTRTQNIEEIPFLGGPLGYVSPC